MLLATSAGTNNDRLWTEMVAPGWMTVHKDAGLPAGTQAFLIRAEAKERVATFLAKCQHSAAMTKLINEVRASIPTRLLDEVNSVNGTPADLAILLAGIVESTMRRAIKPHLHDAFLREVAKVAEGMRSI